MNSAHFICAGVDEYLSQFQFLVIMSNADMNILIHLIWKCVCSPEMDLLDPRTSLYSAC